MWIFLLSADYINLSNSMNKFYVIRDFIYKLKCSFPLEKAAK